MSISKKNKKLENEIVPNLDDIHWNKLNDTIDEYTGYISNVEYAINTELINKVKNLTNIDNFKYNNTSAYDIYKICKIYDVDNKISNIFYTKKKLYDTLVTDLHFKIQDNNEQTKLEIFDKNNIEMTKIRAKIIGIYRTKRNTNVKKFLDKIKNKEQEQYNENINIFTKLENYIEQLIDKNKLTTKTYYIQKLYATKNKAYIFGSFSVLDKKYINCFADDKCIKFWDVSPDELPKKKLKFEVLAEIQVYVGTQGKLKTDEQIQKHNSIENGHNIFYNVLSESIDDTKQKIFMNVQFDIMKNNLIELDKNINNNNVLGCGFVCELKIVDNVFVFSGYEQTISSKIEEFYNMTFNYDMQYHKLIELLKVTTCDNIHIRILEKNINKNSLNLKTIYYINKYDKNISLNFNDEVYVKQKELSAAKSLIFANKYKKYK